MSGGRFHVQGAYDHALLTRKTWLLYGIVAAAGIGLAFGVMGFLHM